MCMPFKDLSDLTKQDPSLTLRSLNFGRSQHCCAPSQNFGEDSLSLLPLIYATDCKSCITSCQLASCLILGFPCQRRLFRSFTGSLLYPSLVLAHCFF